MQTPAEKHIIETLNFYLREYDKKYNNMPRILNIGAGRSVVIEDQMANSSFSFICDRADIETYQISGKYIGNCYHCSVENMQPVKSSKYNVVFSNYLLEHVQDINKAASEIYRTLKPGGIYVTSVPNPNAPEFILAKKTPLWFHKLVRGKEAWETHYAFRDIKTLRILFQKIGFETIEIMYWSFMEGYLNRFAILNILARLYDKSLNVFRFKRLMNNVCIVFRKPFTA